MDNSIGAQFGATRARSAGARSDTPFGPLRPAPGESRMRRWRPMSGQVVIPVVPRLFLEDGRMRFAITMDASERAGLRLSSRLLGLARIMRNGHVQ